MLPSFTPGARQEHNRGVSTLTEFSFLRAQAEALGASVPSVARVTLTLDDGRSLSALRFGDGAPQVTFLHGAGLNAHTWDATILALGVPALAIDLPGHGDSSWRDDLDYSAPAIAPDVAAALAAWTMTPQVLVGQSLGGLTAARVAAQHPELIRDLIVVDITPGIDTGSGPAILREFYAGPTDFASRDDLVERALAFGLGGSRADTERGVFLNTRMRPDGRVEWKHHLAHLAATTFAAEHDPAEAVAPVLRAEGWDDLAAVQAPLTLVRAAQGFVTEADAEEYQRRLPGSRIVVLDAPHNAQETAPAALADLARERIAAASESSL